MAVVALKWAGDGGPGRLVEDVLGHFDGSQVGDHEGDEHREERGGQRCEPERVVQRALRDQDADGHDGENRCEQRPRRTTPEERDTPDEASAAGWE